MSRSDHRDQRDDRDPADDRDLGDEFQPVYARVLRLRYVQPGGLTCLAFFEGSFVLGGLLALAELIPWWGVLVLPVAVAVMVKINDLVAGVVERSAELVPEREQEMFRREVVSTAGRPPRPVADIRPGSALPAGGTGPGIQIRRIGGVHTEATAATCAALVAPTVFLETVPAVAAGPAAAAALAAPTVLLDVVQPDPVSRRQPPAPGWRMPAG